MDNGVLLWKLPRFAMAATHRCAAGSGMLVPKTEIGMEALISGRV